MRRFTIALAILMLLSPAGGGAQQQRPVFRGAIDLVRVDVIVSDEQGDFVDDLSPQDFRIYEDGREQELLDLQLVDLRRGLIERAGTGDGIPAATVLDGTDDGRDPTDLGAIVFLLDGTTIDTANKARFVTAWRQIIEDTSSLRVPRAAYVIDSDRRIRQIAPFTSDVEQLRAAATALDEAAAFGNSIERRLAEVARHVAEFVDEPGVGLEVEAAEADEVQRSHDSLTHLTQFARALSSRPGRKALVWISAGVKVTSGGPYSAVLMEAVDRGMLDDAFADTASAVGADNPLKEWIGREFDDYMPEPRLVDAQERLHEAANSANVSIYALDPTPRYQLRNAGQMAQGRSPMMVNLMGSSRVQSSLDSMRDALRDAADQTGGRSFIHWSELAGALDEIEQDTSRFYLLAYAPPSPEDGRYHRIEVEVARPGLSVRQRRGYLALSAGERSERAVAAALQLPGATKGLEVTAEVFQKWNTVGEPLLQFGVAVRGATPPIPSPSGAEAAPLRVTYVALDDNQRTVWRSDQEVARRAEELPYGVDPGPFVFFDRRWRSLDPGAYDLRIAVLDPASGHIGATQIDVRVPRPSIGWRTSDLMLGVADDDTTQPIIGGRVLAGRKVLAFAEVYGGASPVASVRVFRPDDSGATGDQPWAEMDPQPLARYIDNVHRASLELPRSLGPGRYVIELVVMDYTTRNEATLRAPLEIH